jgi:NADH:ubiquinone oxidoreductase subunit 2 (subunit N)
MKRIIQFSDIVLTGLIAGIIFGVWLGYNPEGLSAVTYVEQQQNTIRALNVLMPILGLISIILTVVYAIIYKREKLERNLLLLAVGLLIISGLITRFGNQPIIAIVITWNLDAIPDTWTA